MNNELYHYYGGELYHSGVKGMRWGKRKAKSEYETTTQPIYKNKRQLRKAQKKYDKAYRKNFVDAQNEVSDYANNYYIDKLNKKYEKQSKNKNWVNTSSYQKYINEYDTEMERVFKKAMEKRIGRRPQ